MKARFLLPAALVSTLACSVIPVAQSAWAAPSGRAEIHVGAETGDLRGSDQRTLQAAVDYVAQLGGGTVFIGPGQYTMRNALTLRSNVRVVGTPGQTVLMACNGLQSPLAADGDCNERQITLAHPDGFRVGDGVSVQDDRKGGFEVTTATLTEQVDANTFRISAPLYLDYMVADKASARLTFPLIGGWQVTNVVVDGITVDGNRVHAQPLNGCRGGGIYLFECDYVTIHNCTVQNYNGDGISFQVSQHVTVEDCRSEHNAGLGLHPGSGSQDPVVRRNQSVGNGGDGLYVCWRVKRGVFQDNVLRDNQGSGISIGHKDSDNVFKGNRIVENARAGVLFREESEPMGAHRNVFEHNVILDNGLGQPGTASVLIRGSHHGLQFRDNTIGYSNPVQNEMAAICASQDSQDVHTEGNHLSNLSQELGKAP